MIIDIDFLDHWKTQLLVDALQDEKAPQYLMRLWAHCQIRRCDTFTVNANALKAICRYSGDADGFEAALIAAGWIERDGDTVTALNWREKNKKLFSNIENGKLGGRPKKNPPENAEETQGNTNGNTDENPSAKLPKPDKSREEKIRGDENKTPKPPKAEEEKNNSQFDDRHLDAGESTPPPRQRGTAQPVPFPDELDVFDFKQFWSANWIPYLMEKSQFGRAPPMATLLEQLSQLVNIVRAEPHQNPQAAIDNLRLAQSRNLYGPILPKEPSKQDGQKRDLLAELAEADS